MLQRTIVLLQHLLIPIANVVNFVIINAVLLFYTDLLLADCLFVALKPTANPEKYSYAGYGIGFYERSLF